MGLVANLYANRGQIQAEIEAEDRELAERARADAARARRDAEAAGNARLLDHLLHRAILAKGAAGVESAALHTAVGLAQDDFEPIDPTTGEKGEGWARAALLRSLRRLEDARKVGLETRRVAPSPVSADRRRAIGSWVAR